MKELLTQVTDSNGVAQLRCPPNKEIRVVAISSTAVVIADGEVAHVDFARSGQPIITVTSGPQTASVVQLGAGIGTTSTTPMVESTTVATGVHVYFQQEDTCAIALPDFWWDVDVRVTVSAAGVTLAANVTYERRQRE